MAVELGARGLYRIEAEAPGFWVPAAWVSPDDADRSIELVFHPEGQVEVELEPVPLEEFARGFEVRFSFSAGSGEETARRSCEWHPPWIRCAVPAGVVDLRIKTPGFAGLFFFDVRVAPGTTSPLGRQALVRGGSIVGWIGNPPGAPALRSPLRVELEQESASGSGIRGARPAVQEPLLAKGRAFFQFRGLAPGAYRLRAVSAKGGEAAVGGLKLEGDGELELRQPLFLLEPIVGRLQVSPARAPGGAAWQVSLRRIEAPERLAKESFTASTDPLGRVEFDRLLPGRYAVQVLDPSGLPVSAGNYEIAVGQTVSIELGFRRVQGTVRLGERPLPATLRFGGLPHAVPRAVLEADAEGRFFGSVPVATLDAVAVLAPEEEVEVVLTDFPRRELEDGTLDLELVVEGAELPLRVVDVEGRPVPGAEVGLVSFDGARPAAGRLRRRAVDPSGRVRFRFLEPGPYLVFASGKIGSQPLAHRVERIEVQADAGAREHELILGPARRVVGRVVDREGRPVPGAWVRGFGWNFRAGGSVAGTEAVSDFEGRFGLLVPEGLEEMTFEVAPAVGGGLRARKARVPPPGQELALLVDPFEGELELVREREEEQEKGWDSRLLLFQDGVPLFGSFAWARQLQVVPEPEGLYRIPRLAPGHYRLCPVEDRWAVMTGGRESLRRLEHGCSEGYLAPGTTLPLEVPQAKRQASEAPRSPIPQEGG